jgi:hypothetical protein
VSALIENWPTGDQFGIGLNKMVEEGDLRAADVYNVGIAAERASHQGDG